MWKFVPKIVKLKPLNKKRRRKKKRVKTRTGD